MLISSHYCFPFPVSEVISLRPMWSIFPITSLQQGLVEQTVLLASRGTFLPLLPYLLASGGTFPPLLPALLVFYGSKDWEEM